MTNKLEYQNIQDVKTKGDLAKNIGYKPLFATYAGLAIGVLLMLTLKIPLIIMGAVFIVFALFVLFKVKDYKTMDIYSEGVTVYALEDDNRAIFIPFDDIQEWTTKKTPSGSEAVFLLLNDGTNIYKDTFQASIAFRTLNRYIQNKESNYLKMQKLNEKPLFTNPFKKKK